MRKFQKRLENRKIIINFVKTKFMDYQIINDNCLTALTGKSINQKIDLTFLDPPFNSKRNMLITMIVWMKKNIGK